MFSVTLLDRLVSGSLSLGGMATAPPCLCPVLLSSPETFP